MHYSTKWVSIHRSNIRRGAVVVIPSYNEQTDSPEFGLIMEIFVIPTKLVLLGVKMLEVVDYSTHYHCWAVTYTENKRVVDFKDLCSHQILQARTSNLSFGIVKFISMKCSIF